MASFGERLRSVVERIAATLGGAALLGTIATAIDARWAVHTAGPARYGATFFADFGLIAPMLIGIGVATAGAVIFFHGFRAPTTEQLARLRRDTPAAVPLLAALGLVVWLGAVARLGLWLFSSELGAAATGATLGVVAASLAVATSLAVAGGARAFAERWPAPRLDATVALGLGLAFVVVVLAAGIVTGTTGGAGRALAIFGVFKRDELDLRGPALAVAVALGGYAGAFALRGRRAALGLLAVLGLGFTLRAAGSGLSDRRVALAIERGAPFGRLALGPLRRFGDRDHDGYSRLFGGGDCNDADPAVNPGASDVPGNGKDEDCSGSDDKPVVLERAKQAPVDARSWIAQRLPANTNVILITVDTLRYDLGYMGYPRAVSPNLDRLVERAVLFDKAYALASYTAKSVGPMLIGKYSSETHRDFTHFTRYPKPEKFVQERLQSAGIRTLSLQALWYFYQQGTGYERGFDVLDFSAAPKVIAVNDDRTITGDKLADATIAALAAPERAQKRFYMWVHFLDLHEEYVHHPDFDFGTKDRDLYDSEVAFVDHQIGRILAALEKQPYAQRTAIVVTSDHGEAFREHGMIRHGFELWEELVRVPLIVAMPGAPAHRVEPRRSAIDVVATLLDVYGLEQPGSESDFVDGQSLLSDVYLPPGYTPLPRLVFVDMCAGPNNAERQAFIDGDLKLTAAYGRPLGLYDLARDPAEKTDLLDDATFRDRIVPRYRAFRRSLRQVRIRETP